MDALAWNDILLSFTPWYNAILLRVNLDFPQTKRKLSAEKTQQLLLLVHLDLKSTGQQRQSLLLDGVIGTL